MSKIESSQQPISIAYQNVIVAVGAEPSHRELETRRDRPYIQFEDFITLSLVFISRIKAGITVDQPKDLLHTFRLKIYSNLNFFDLFAFLVSCPLRCRLCAASKVRRELALLSPLRPAVVPTQPARIPSLTSYR